MKRIAIIGANGQVGSEVCLFLDGQPGIEVVPISRTEIGSVFLRACGFAPRHGDIATPADAKRLVGDVDLVADFSLPGGSSVEVRAAIAAIVGSALDAAPSGVPYVYLSSITAFGVPDFRGPLKYYRLSRNQYGGSKRFGESLVREQCGRAGRDAYVLRVGVVHGELQAVSRQTERDLRLAEGIVTYVPDAPSFTVFAFSIAEALAAIAHGREAPGTYTLVSSPAWSWLDVHRYFAARAGVDAPAVALAAEPLARKRPLRSLAGASWRMAAAQKDLVGGYLATALPSIELRLRSRYHERNALAEVADGGISRQYRPYGNNHDEFGGARLGSLSDSRTTMEPAAREVRARLAALLTPDRERAS